MKKLLPFLFLLCNVGLAQTSQTSLMITRIYGIQAGWAGECAAGVISNVSAVSRHNNYHSIYATGSGAWTVAMNFSDVSCAGPWTSFGSQATITQVSNPPIGYGNGFHPYIQIVVTGAATVTYSACKDFYLASSLASAVYPITLAQGGTGASSFTAHGVLVGEGSSALSVTAAGTTNYGLVSNGASADPTFQAIVNSFNTRTGAVVPTTGDYTAAMVTNAVDTTQTYNAPSWLTGISAANCPTCVTTSTTQTITGAKTFNGGVYVGSNQVIDGNGFSAWGGAGLNDSTALGYVVSNVDHTWTDQDNEARGVSSVVRAVRTTVDEGSNGWDQFGLAGVVVLGAMNLPSDPSYCPGGTCVPYIRGQQKAVDSELYYQTPVAPYTANLGMNYLASLAQVASGVTLNTWAGLIVGTPGFIGPNGGHVVNGYGVWIQNLLDTNSILTPATTSAIKIDGLGNYGRILWQGASAYVPTAGVLEFSGTVGVQTAAGVGFKVGGSGANAGLAAGSYAVGGTTIIDGSLNISTTGYVNTSNAFEIGGVTAIDSSRNGSFAGLTASGATTLSGYLTIDVTGMTQCLHVNSLGVVSGTGADCGSGGGGGGGGSGNPFPGSVTANTNLTAGAGYYLGPTGIMQCDSTGCATISIGNVYNVSVSGDIVDCTRTGAACTSYPHHVDTGSYYLAGSPIITGAGAATLLSLELTGASTTGVTAQCLHVDTTGAITGTGADCGSGGGGPSFTGTVTANSALTVGAGFFMGPTGIIQYASGLPSPAAANIGNVYNIDAYGDIRINPTTAAHHVSSGTDPTNGGYWLGATQIITGAGQITTNITGSVQCLHVNALGVISGTSADCGSGGGGGTPGGSSGQIQYNNAGVFGGFTAGGDLTFSQPSFTLNTVNSSPVSCGSSTQSCVLTINGKGLVTASSTATISGGGGGGNPFAGTVTANTALTDQAGFYMNTIGVIQWSSSLSAVNIGNVLNINSNSGNIVTCQMSGGSCVGAGTGHVGSGAGTYGGYYIYNTQIIDGSANAHLNTVNGSSGIFTGSVTANATPTNTAGFYIQFPSSNGTGYTGNTGIIQYATGSPSVVNIGHVQDITAGGTIFTTGHLAATPASDIVAETLTGYTGGSADLLDVYNQAGGTDVFSVGHSGTFAAHGAGSSSNSSLLFLPQSSYNDLILSSGIGATYSAFQLVAVAGATPYITLQQGYSNYIGADGPGCARFIGGVCISGSSGPYNVQAYNFTPYSCNMTTSVCTPGGTSSGTLSSGTHTLTFTPCPVGAASFVPASPHAFWYYVSGGSGTSEAVSVSGTTCTSGLSTGTMTLYALSYSHTGAFVIGSATAGAQEAAIAAGATNAGNPTGALYFPAGIYWFYAPVYIDNGARVFGDGTAESFIANLNGGNGLFDVDGGPAVSVSNLRMDSVGAVSSGNYAIRIGFNVETTFSSVDHVLFNNFYDEILGVSMNQLHVTDSTFYLFSHTGITVADALCTDCIGAFITSSAFYNYGYSTPAEAAVLVKSGSDIQISNSSMIGTGTTNLNWCVEALYAAGDGGEFHITGSKCEATALGGYSIAGYWPGTIISGNVLGNASASGWSGISLTGTGGTSKGWNVSGNLVNCSSAASSNGLYFQGTYSGSVVSGNTLDGCNFGINANGSPTNVVLGINNITNSLTSPVYVASSQVIVDGTTTEFNHYGLTDTSGGVGNAGDGSRLYCTDCNITCTLGSSTGQSCVKVSGAWTH